MKKDLFPVPSKKYSVPGSMVSDILKDVSAIIREFRALNADVEHFLKNAPVSDFLAQETYGVYSAFGVWEEIAINAGMGHTDALPDAFQATNVLSLHDEINRALEVSLYWTLYAHIRYYWYPVFENSWLNFSDTGRGIVHSMFPEYDSDCVVNGYQVLRVVLEANRAFFVSELSK